MENWVIGIISFATLYMLMTQGWQAYKTIRARGGSLQTLCFRFKQKILMTAGLGVVFGSLYIALLFLAPYLLNKDNVSLLFALARQHPCYFLCSCLLFFILNAVFICMIRSMLTGLIIRFDKRR